VGVPGDDIEQRGLTCAVGSGDADDLRFVNGERNPVERGQLSETFSDVGRDQSQRFS
jgi:hypothetical protein